MKKSIYKILTLSTLLIILAGCKGSNEGATTPPNATPTPAANSTPTPEPTPEPPKDEVDGGYTEVPMNLNGRKIVMMSTTSSRYNYAADKDKTINDTLWVMDRLREIEADYNCTIEVVAAPSGNSIVPNFVALKASGDTSYDIFEGGVSDLPFENLYSNNIVMPVTDPKIADIIKPNENPWLNESQLSIMFGIQYGVHYKTINNSDLLRAVVLFNKDLLEKYELENPYDLVRNRQWTWEKLEEMSAQIVAKSDGSVYPIDRPGESVLVPAMIFSNNGKVAVNTTEGYKYVANTDEKTLAALNQMVSLITKNYLVALPSGKTFATADAVFSIAIYDQLKKLTTQTLVNESRFGLLPMPLGPDAIKDGMEYHSVTYYASMNHIMNNIEKPEEAAAILVAMANRISKINIIKAEVDYTLQDDDSAEMLQLMLDNVVVDESRAVGVARATIRNSNNNIVNLTETPKQALDSIAEKVQSEYDSIKVIAE